ncbi:hypothetical protein DQT32_04495 [Salmonella enterica subsp. enterica serovar Braenderup]|nr:hypothetical protein [Salmonella enterica subsp. enterica serovar Braenderup]
MTKAIYDRAVTYSDKVMKLYHEMVKFDGRVSKSIYVKKRYGFNNKFVSARNNVYEQYKTVISLVDDLNQLHLKNCYKITDDPSFETPKKLQEINEFSEELDFQLSTVLTDEQLYDYYIKCKLYYYGFRGAVRKMVHHTSWNAYIRVANSINYDFKRAEALKNGELYTPYGNY